MVTMDSGKVVYAKNPDERLPIASITKIMTYIVAYENIPEVETTKIKVDKSVDTLLLPTGSSLANISVGEEFTALQLLKLMMIPSGNDAALVLAQYIDNKAGSILTAKGTDEYGVDAKAVNMEGSAFIDLMNKKAKELGCENTNFTNPHGLHYKDHYSTARDMAVIARYATTLPYFSDITSSLSYKHEPTNMCEGHEVYSTNSMLSQYADDGAYYYPYATGIKTGSLNESGYCIASSAKYQGYSYIVVALGSPYVDDQGNRINNHGEMLDAAALFRWAFTSLELKTVAPEGTLVSEVDLKYAWGKDKLQVAVNENVQALMPMEVSNSSVLVEMDLPEKVQAPVKKGDVIGYATFTYADEQIAKVNVVAAESIERSEIVQTLEIGKDVITSPIFIVIASVVGVILLIYFISIIAYNRRKKKMRKVKKYRNL